MIPTLACIIIHVLIFIHVRSSSRRVRTEVFSVQKSLAGKRRRDATVLRQATIIYVTFVFGNTPIAVLYAMDKNRLVDAGIYASLQCVGSLSSLIIMMYLIWINNEMKVYLRQKLKSRLRP